MTSKFDQIRRFLMISGFVVLSIPLAFAQTGSNILGRIADASGSVVPGATIELQNESTGVAMATSSAGSGDYSFTNVDPGVYQITASAKGFQNSILRHLTIQVAQTARFDINLEVGSVAQSVDVKASAPLVQSDSSSVGSVVDGSQIQSMPLNGRGSATDSLSGIYGLLALAPGVQRSNSNALISGGAFSGGTNSTVDGMVNNDVFNARMVGSLPSLEGISEFRVVTANASAEFGRGGSQVIIETKSGGNEFHGTLFEFNRNAVFAAKNFFATSLPRPPFNRNEFGGSLGGRIIRNKLFFFGSYEDRRSITSTAYVEAMPTAAIEAGNFAGLKAVIDPLSGSPFPNNQIPSNRISGTSQKLQSYYSSPNLPGSGAAGTGNNFAVTVPTREIYGRYSARTDYDPTDKDRISVRFYKSDDGPYFYATSGTDKFGNYWIGTLTRDVAASYTRVLLPSVLNEFRAGFHRELDPRLSQNHNLDPSTIIPSLPSTPTGDGGLPTVNITGFKSLADQPGNIRNFQNVYQLSDNLSWVRGSHTMKFGMQYQHFLVGNGGIDRGTFNFSGLYTGNAYADFLLGDLAGSSRVSAPQVYTSQDYNVAAFAQDDWIVNSRLTLNVGVRYEYASPFHNLYSGMANFYPGLGLVYISGTPDPALSAAYPVLQGSNVGINSSNYLELSKTNFAPRFGFAYRPLASADFVVRGGYGIFYDAMGLNTISGLGNQPPFLISESYLPVVGSTPTLFWSNPFPNNLYSPAIINLNAVERYPHTPYSQQWNLTIEKALPGKFVFRTSYVGNKGTHLGESFNLNDPPPQPGAVQPQRPYQPWGSIGYTQFSMSTITHQLQAGVSRRLAEGMTFDFEYQFTRALGQDGTPMDNQNERLDRGNLNYYARNYAIGNYLYELPFGRDKRYLSTVSPFLNKFVGGWQLAGIVVLSSGQPYSVTFTSTVQGWPSGRANVVGDPSLASPSINEWFNPAAYAVPAPYTYGDSARNSLFGPNLVNWNATLAKNTRLSERLSLEIRAEFFNVLNHPSFNVPASNISVPSQVGTITSTSTDPREVQFGARLSF